MSVDGVLWQGLLLDRHGAVVEVRLLPGRGSRAQWRRPSATDWRPDLDDGFFGTNAAIHLAAVLARSGSALGVGGRAEWMIWSNEHRAWWKPDRCGYTTCSLVAGLYTLPEVLVICSAGALVQTSWGQVPDEIPVPSPSLVAALAAVDGLRPASYILQEYRSGFEQEVTLECRRNEAGDLWWLVHRAGCDLTRELRFEYAPRASDEDKPAFFARARYSSPAEALDQWRRWFSHHPDPVRPWLLADGTEEVL